MYENPSFASPSFFFKGCSVSISCVAIADVPGISCVLLIAPEAGRYALYDL